MDGSVCVQKMLNHHGFWYEFVCQAYSPGETKDSLDSTAFTVNQEGYPSVFQFLSIEIIDR